MKNYLKKIGKEFELIADITAGFGKVIGDDCAIVNVGGKKLLITVDTLVENDHFNLKWSTPQQIGKKAVEVSVSDITSMGGIPKHLLVSLVLSSKNLSWVKKMYAGMKSVCNKYKITLIGGDTTKGTINMISTIVIGESGKKINKRSDAKTGDLICVTGKCGGSGAGFIGFKKGLKMPPYIKKRHCDPKSRYDISSTISGYANAMIDISDGIASETKHVAYASNKGAVIYKEKIPLHRDVINFGKKISIDPYKFALSGGEDFELLFTISSANLKNLQKKVKDITIIGKILPKKEGIYLLDKNKKLPLPKGWDQLGENL